jgi:hypothetical protein
MRYRGEPTFRDATPAQAANLCTLACNGNKPAPQTTNMNFDSPDWPRIFSVGAARAEAHF